MAIVLAASVEAGPQLTALRSEAQRRGLQLPGRFAVRTVDLATRLRGRSSDAPSCRKARTLDEAIATVTPFLYLLLDATARGRWESAERPVDLITPVVAGRERQPPATMRRCRGLVREGHAPWPTLYRAAVKGSGQGLPKETPTF